MELIIQEIAEMLSDRFKEELEQLITEGRDISEFIIVIKGMLDGIGTKLVAKALEIVD